MRINAIPANLMPRAVTFDSAAYALRGKLLEALNGSSASSPVEVEKLYPLGAVDQVQAGLMSLHRSGEVQCVHIASAEEERSVWWRAGNVPRDADWYGIRGKQAEAKPQRTKRKLSPLSAEINAIVCAQPGLTYKEVFALSGRPDAEYYTVLATLRSLIKCGYLTSTGARQERRLYPETQAEAQE